jgi:hypothetical protein
MVAPNPYLDVMDHPGHALEGPVSEVDDAGHQHELEVPGRLPVFEGDGATLGTGAFVGQLVLLDPVVALLTGSCSPMNGDGPFGVPGSVASPLAAPASVRALGPDS